jgi:hypothetical protein
MPNKSPRERMIDDLHTREGAVSPTLRQAIMARAQTLIGEPPSEGVPAHLHTYVDKLAKHAYKVTDEDIEALGRTHSTHEIYEITVAAAVGAALGRRELAMTLLRAGRSS